MYQHKGYSEFCLILHIYLATRTCYWSYCGIGTAGSRRTNCTGDFSCGVSIVSRGTLQSISESNFLIHLKSSGLSTFTMHLSSFKKKKHDHLIDKWSFCRKTITKGIMENKHQYLPKIFLFWSWSMYNNMYHKMNQRSILLTDLQDSIPRPSWHSPTGQASWVTVLFGHL